MAQRLSPDPEIYTTLDSSKIISTIERLSRRIGERFPDSGLYGVAQQLLALAHQSKERAQYVSRPIHWIRITIGGLIGLIIAGVVGMTIALTALDFTAICPSRRIRHQRYHLPGRGDLLFSDAGSAV